MGIAEKIGGIPALTAVLVVATGIIGAALGKFVFDAIGIADYRVRGFALGIAAHGIGTARAFQVNAEAGAFAGLAFGLQGALAAFLFPRSTSHCGTSCKHDKTSIRRPLYLGDILGPALHEPPQAMQSDLLSAAILLLLVIDPFGNVPLVVSTLQPVPPERRSRVVLRECLIAYILLLAFMFGGHAFLTLMRLSETSLSIAGGVILFLIALKMVFSRHPDGVFGDPVSGEPLIVPLAIPAIAGPSAMATVMLMASREPGRIETWVLALSLAMVGDDGGARRRRSPAAAARRTGRPRFRAVDGTGVDCGGDRDAAGRYSQLRRAVCAADCAAGRVTLAFDENRRVWPLWFAAVAGALGYAIVFYPGAMSFDSAINGGKPAAAKARTSMVSA